jgi:hypothetical protein
MLAASALIATTGAAWAGPGHDHGDEAPANGGMASPRLHAHSDLFELVGIVDQGQMTVYLDRYASNEPLHDARIEFESGAQQGVAQPQADGSYLIKFDALAQAGQLPFSFTVTAGTDTDLLAADLDLGEPHAHEAAPGGRAWLRWLGYALALAALAGIATLSLRRLSSSRVAHLND